MLLRFIKADTISPPLIGITKWRMDLTVSNALEEGSAAVRAPSEAYLVEVSVVLPCLNEAETLAVCIEKAQAELGACDVKGEVIVADNGSSDGSQDIARRAGARVVPVSEKGYGAALMGGISAAQGRYVIMADADDSYSLDDMRPFIESLRGGDQLVMGNRFQGGIAPGAMPWLHRRLGNPVLSWLGRTFFDIPIGDFHCGMRGFDREAIIDLGLRTTGMEFASEMVVKASLHKLRISEVPTRLQPDGRSRAPHLRTWRDGWRHLRFLLAYSPRWLFLYPGLTLTAVGSIGVAWQLGGERVIGSMRFDLLTMLVFAMAVLVGLQAVWFAVIAKSFALSEGLHPPDARTERWLRRLSLEKSLLVGGGATLAGLVTLLVLIVKWASVGFGDLDVFVTMRLGILAATLLVVGVQNVFSGFLLSLVTVRRN